MNLGAALKTVGVEYSPFIKESMMTIKAHVVSLLVKVLNTLACKIQRGAIVATYCRLQRFSDLESVPTYALVMRMRNVVVDGE